VKGTYASASYAKGIQMSSTRWKPSTETLLDLLQTAAILTGIVFGLRELGELRKSRELESTLALVSLAQDESAAVAMRRLISVPANLPGDQFDQHFGSDADKVWMLTGYFECLGILVHRGEISLDLVDEFLGGDIVNAWQKLSPYVTQVRQQSGNPQGLACRNTGQSQRRVPHTSSTAIGSREQALWFAHARGQKPAEARYRVADRPSRDR
jgi:hypothetical protein